MAWRGSFMAQLDGVMCDRLCAIIQLTVLIRWTPLPIHLYSSSGHTGCRFYWSNGSKKILGPGDWTRVCWQTKTHKPFLCVAINNPGCRGGAGGREMGERGRGRKGEGEGRQKGREGERRKGEEKGEWEGRKGGEGGRRRENKTPCTPSHKLGCLKLIGCVTNRDLSVADWVSSNTKKQPCNKARDKNEPADEIMVLIT